MKRNVKGLDSGKLMVYSEILTKMVGDLDSIGMQATIAHRDGQISDKDKGVIQEELIKKINIYEPIRIEVITEINKRFKKDLNVIKGVSDINTETQEMREKYPNMFLTKAEYDYKIKNDKIKTAKGKSKLKALPN